MIDIEEIYKFKQELPAADAKAAIQKYCKENGMKVPKTGISVKDQISLIMDKLDAIANGVTETSSFGPPVVDEEIVVDTTPVTEVMECDGACPIDLNSDEIIIGQYRVPKEIEAFVSEQIIDVYTPRVDMHQPGLTGILHVSQIGNFDVAPGHSTVFVPKDYNPKTDLIGYGKDAYMNLPYWILDWINEQPRDWKINVHQYDGNDKDFLFDMLYYIMTNGKVVVRESRNSQFHHFF